MQYRFHTAHVAMIGGMFCCLMNPFTVDIDNGSESIDVCGVTTQL